MDFVTDFHVRQPIWCNFSSRIENFLLQLHHSFHLGKLLNSYGGKASISATWSSKAGLSASFCTFSI